MQQLSPSSSITGWRWRSCLLNFKLFDFTRDNCLHSQHYNADLLAILMIFQSPHYRGRQLLGKFIIQKIEMSVRLNKRYSLLIVILFTIILFSFLNIPREKIEITVINEFFNHDGEAGAGGNQELKFESCRGVQEPVSDVR